MLHFWQEAIKPFYPEARFCQLMERVEETYRNGTVYPPRPQLFSALEKTPPEKVRAVILGQDPYHGEGQANGLAFSVPEGVAFPPSLRNIFQELQDDVGLLPPREGDLTFWAEQGVLLLNSVLTVQAGQAGSHAALGWQEFTDAVISACGRLPQPVSFVLWGAYAQKKAPLLDKKSGPRLLLQAPHPSPLSSYRGFFGSRPFSRINAFLRENGVEEIIWGK